MKQSIHDMSDGQRVVLAAELQDRSEFDVFDRAYRDWYGQPADLRTLEHEFVQYLYFGTTPPWVRHYTRRMLDEQPDAAARRPRNIGIGSTLMRLVDSRVGRYLLS